MPPINRNPGAIVRILAYAGDFSLGQLLFHGLISVGHVRGLYESLRAMVKLQGAGGDAIATVIAVYVITTVIRFYSSAILGVSLTQWFLGISNGSKGVAGRLCAAARVAIEFILLPLIIPMLSVLNGKPSWIERISTALLKKGQGLRGILGYLARPIVIAFIFMGVFAPLLRNLAVIEGVQVEFSEIPDAKIEQGSDFSKFRFFHSSYFGFTTFGDLEAGRFILLPQFEVTKEANETRIRPFLGVYDSRTKSLGFLKKESLIDWRKLSKLAQQGNPFFNSSYPFLSGEIQKDSDKEFSQQALNDLEELVIASLELSFSNVSQHVLKHGPFLGGYIDLRQALLGLLDSGAMPRVDAVNLGDKKFLRFRQLFDEVPTVEKKYREILLPLGSTRGPILRYEWDASLDAAVARRDFATAFFAQARWGSKDHDSEELTPLCLVDLLLSKNLSSQKQKELHEYSYRWFWETSRRALRENDEVLLTWLTLTMNRVYLIGQGRADHDKLGKMFLMMIHALESKDKDFFDLNGITNE